MRVYVLAIVALAMTRGASLFANEVPLSKDGTDYVFGDKGFCVVVDREGFFKEILSYGEVMLKADPHDAPFDLKEPSGPIWTNYCGKTVFKGIDRLDAREIRSRVVAGPWQIDFHFIVDVERRMLGRRMVLDRTVDDEGEYHGGWLDSGIYDCGEEGGYFMPFRFPTVMRKSKQFKVGRQENSWIAASPVIADNGRGGSVLWAHDWARPYGEETPCVLTERADGRIRMAYKFSRSCGYVRRHEPQVLGDVWCWFRNGDGESTLRAMSDWYRAIGQVSVDDRPEWVQRTKLYCLHPGGTIESHNQDWGGFRSAADQLDRIVALGCNAVWLRPVEDEQPYHPRDYYKLQPEIGTPDDYRAFVSKAHRLGLRVLQDLVPHGGGSTNMRANAHPEWLVRRRDGSELTYWCFDFLSPTWIGYMENVADFYMREYGIDGFRIDAATGSKEANWTRGTPYARASLSLEQGGLAMQRAIRNVVKAVKPDAANLAETKSSLYSTTSDAIYDVDLAYKVFPYFAEATPKAAVRELRRWLHEQSFAQVPGTIPMRYVESHDCRRSVPYYGERAQHAFFAVTAFIPGMVMINQELEDGRFEVYRDILGIRTRTPEIDCGTADYLSMKVPDGVFACLRKLDGKTSVVLVNFNGRSIDESVVLPEGERTATSLRDVSTGEMIPLENGAAKVALSPYAYRVLRIGSEIPEFPPRSTPFVVEETPVVHEVSRTAKELVLAVDGVDEWFALTAEGVQKSPFRVRHPGCDGVTGAIMYDPCGGSLLFDSWRTPFGLDADHAAVGFVRGGVAYSWYGLSGRHVRLLDRKGEYHGLKVVVDIDGGVDFPVLPEKTSLPDACLRVETIGDPRVTLAVGGWVFEENRLRVRFARNGAIVGIWRRNAAGIWAELVRNAQIVSRKGYNHERAPKGFEQRYDLEPNIAFSREVDGTLVFSFEGRLRGPGRMAKMKDPISYQTTLRFKGDETFVITVGCEVCAASADAGELMYRAESVASDMKFPSCDWSEQGRITAGKKRVWPFTIQINEKE